MKVPGVTLFYKGFAKILFLLGFGLIFFFAPCLADNEMPEFICEIGIKFYQQGRYAEALHEFKKALMVTPNYGPALKYIQMIEQREKIAQPPDEEKIVTPIVTPVLGPAKTSSAEAAGQYLDLFQIQKEMIDDIENGKIAMPEKRSLLLPRAGPTEEWPVQAVVLPETLTLEALSAIKQTIEIERGESIILSGKDIQRFLLTEPGIITVERKNSDELIITGKAIGYTYLHVWDDSGRNTLEFLTVLPRPKGLTLEEELRLQEEQATSFKLRYSVNWHSFEQGPRIDNLSQQYYSWDHTLGLTGASPYGNIDSTALVRTLKSIGTQKTTDLRYFTVGLTEGRLGPFSGFSFRGGDFYPNFFNIASSGMLNLRGAMLESPAFNERVNYSIFQGREGTGRFGGLSPGLPKQRRSYLEGVDLNYDVDETKELGFSYIHGYGRDRASNLNSDDYDLRAAVDLGKWWHGYEIAFNTETFAHLLNGHYIIPKLKFDYELRNFSKNYINTSANVWRRGELGGLFTLNYSPTEKWDIDSRLDVFRDRLFASAREDDAWNQDFDFRTRYHLDPATTLKADYTLQNEYGRLAEVRYQSLGTGINKSFNLIRTVNAYADYRHQEKKSPTNPSADYTNEKVSTGIRFSLIRQLYYFADQEWNWLTESFNGTRSNPRVFQTGIDLSSQVLNTPFYENLRVIYRNEEDTASPLSFLAGEDYLEGYAELSFRPNPDTEAYLSTRVRNIWAENPNATKRLEADFSSGVRYVWDTGLHWQSVGNIEGYVFRDLNSDGLRQKEEAPVEGIRVWLGKKRSGVTDIFGYYKFSKVKGKKAYIMLDSQTLPSGFVLTVPQRQETPIVQRKTVRIDFGIISKSEAVGIIFYDANENGEFDSQDTGIKNVGLSLENGVKAVSEASGRFIFRNVSTGKHEITLDLKSLPKEYLPAVPISKEFDLFDGVTYTYNIPLKKIQR